MNEEKINKYAELIVAGGANVYKGQKVIIRANTEIADFVNCITEIAYKEGASEVKVIWDNNKQTILNVNNQTIEDLSRVYGWELAKMKQRVKDKPAMIYLESDDPEALKGINIQKYSESSKKRHKKFKKLIDKIENEYQWTIAAVPSKDWAKRLFPNLRADQAVTKLWNTIFDICHIEEEFPIAEWTKHNLKLTKIRDYINSLEPTKLRFRSQKTDFEVGINPETLFLSGKEQTKKGISFSPNIPTEEIFGTPDTKAINGTVYATKPFVYEGNLVTGAWFTFENGKISDYGSDPDCLEVLKSLVEKDKGSKTLGEIAIVPIDSGVAKAGILFYNTLFDENAACHMAIGRGFSESFKNKKLSKKKLKKLGLNDSMVHQDIMISDENTTLDIITKDSKVITVLENGKYTKDFLDAVRGKKKIKEEVKEEKNEEAGE